jgi:CIC family chloride channel protein
VNELLWKHVTELPLAVRILSPIAAMTIAGIILQTFRVKSSAMADEVVQAYHEPDTNIASRSAAPKLAASVATMGLGASAGMEGASKWLGAAIGQWVQRRLNGLRSTLFHGGLRRTMLAGGSAGIAAIFRAPLSGAIMGVESPYKNDLAHDALLPALVGSATSFWAFTLLRPATPYFPVNFHYTLATKDLLVAVPLGLSAGLASHLFLWTLARCRGTFGARVPSVWMRAALGGAVLAAIAWCATLVVGDPVTLHSGLPVANALLFGKYALGACLAIFALKLLATSVTFGAGGVGGLFVPTATIGAALGAAWDVCLPASHPGVYTLLGIAAFSGASYNSLLFSAVFIAESTGNVFLVVPALIASTVAFLATAGVSNSRSQRSRRPGWREAIDGVPLARIMTTEVVTASAGQSLDEFSRSILLQHHFKALPVAGADRVLVGMISVGHLRGVPQESWGTRTVGDVMDSAPRTLTPGDAASDAERLISEGDYDYVPVVDPQTRRLVGVVSFSDIHRARDAADAG